MLVSAIFNVHTEESIDIICRQIKKKECKHIAWMFRCIQRTTNRNEEAYFWKVGLWVDRSREGDSCFSPEALLLVLWV